MIEGRVIDVRDERAGTELTAAAVATDTTLEVLDVTELDLDGGVLELGGEVHEYTVPDEEVDEVELATPLVAGYDAEAPVYVSPEAVERWALVLELESEEEIEVRVPHALRDRLAEGMREDDDTAETVLVDNDDDDYSVVDVLYEVPVVDGSFIDPATLVGGVEIPLLDDFNRDDESPPAGWHAVTAFAWSADEPLYLRDNQIRGNEPGDDDAYDINAFDDPVALPLVYSIRVTEIDHAGGGGNYADLYLDAIPDPSLKGRLSMGVEPAAWYGGGEGSILTIYEMTDAGAVVDSEAGPLDVVIEAGDEVAIAYNGSTAAAWYRKPGQPWRKGVEIATSGDVGGPLEASISVGHGTDGRASFDDFRGGRGYLNDAGAFVPVTGGSDGNAPASSPTPTVTGGPGFLRAEWSPVANLDLVTYEAHLSTSSGFTPDASTLVAEIPDASSIVIATEPDGTPLLPATTYYVKVIARDVDGSAPASAEDDGQIVLIDIPYIEPIDFTDITGQALEAQIANNAITVNKIAADAVTAGKIATDAVGTDEIAALAVTSAEVAALAITTAKIAADAVTAAEIAADAVGNTEIATGAVDQLELAADAVTAAKIAADAVGTSEIGLDAVTASEIAALAVGSSELAAGAVIAGKIAAGTIVAADVATNTLTANEIAANAITASELAANSVVAGDIVAGTIVAADIAANVITANEIATNAITADELAANSITAADILAGTITTAEIAAGTIVAANIAANTLTATEINAGAITSSELASDAVIAGKIAAGTIVAADIAANTITAAQIGADAITASELAANSVVAGDIVAGTIVAADIAANTITAGQIATNAITADELAANSITAADILAGTITTAEIAANTIKAADIEAGTITSAEINVSSIQAAVVTAAAVSALTITGATIRTSSSNPKIELDSTDFSVIESGGTEAIRLKSADGLVLASSSSSGGALSRSITWAKSSYWSGTAIDAGARAAQMFTYLNGSVDELWVGVGPGTNPLYLPSLTKILDSNGKSDFLHHASLTPRSASNGGTAGDAAANTAVGVANRAFICEIPVFSQQAITGIRYKVGGTSAGNVRSALYSSTGIKLAERTTNAGQGAAGTVDQVPFDSTYTPTRAGVVYALLIFGGSTATFAGTTQLGNAGRQTEASLTVPASITPPTTGFPASTQAIPLMTLY